MLGRLIAIAAILTLGVGIATAGDDPAQAKQVQNDVRKYISSEYLGDVATFIKLTHATEVEMAGGIDAFELQHRNLARMLKAAGMRVEQIKFPSLPQFFEGKDGRRFVVVPTLMTTAGIDIKGRVRRFVNKDFELGILDPGAGGWKYVGGHVGDKGVAGIQARFSDFPSGVTLPPRTRMEVGG